MRIKTYAKAATDTLHVTGVDADELNRFKAFVEASEAPASFYVNQMLAEFNRSAIKAATGKGRKTKNAAA